jgi:hypothetical protein
MSKREDEFGDRHLRLWSIHPKYLDRAGLVALWRESLLAQKVLKAETRGYKNHPQLHRFKNHPRPENAIAGYLMEVWRESKRRGYNFNRQKIATEASKKKMPITRGQLNYEFGLLCKRLKRRDADRCQRLISIHNIDPHPSFAVIDGEVEDWEKI